MKNVFVLPEIESLLASHGKSSDKIIVISVIGKSTLSSMGLKVKPISRFFSPNANRSAECTIEGYYDEDKRVMYLHAHTLLDTECLIDHYEELVGKHEDKNVDFLSIYDYVKSSFAKTFMVLLYVSHIVVLHHPGSSFDVNYVQYFKAVDSFRQKVGAQLSDALRDIDSLNPEWVASARPCTPRLIFYFERCPKDISNLKKMEHNIEDRIYQILKKSRIINSNNCTSLFAIPMNDEFVYMSTEEPTDQLGHSVHGLIMGLQPGATLQVKAPFSTQSNVSKSFTKFLQVHIRQARDKGFDDVVASSRQLVLQPSYFELPSIPHWAEATKVVYNVIMAENIQSLCTETRFSEQRCEKVFPMALARYQEGLPSHYSRTVHETRMNIALNLFGAQARGPKFQEYSEKLITNCNAYWEGGKQTCEAPSLTGNLCNLPKNFYPDHEHCSGIRYIAACDCGRTQGTRDDPYTVKLANYTFYQQISKGCACSGLDRHTFPTFEPSVTEFTAAALSDNEDSTLQLSDQMTLSEVKTLSKQASTTEYLPGMLTLTSPPNLLPQYPSWSLVCLGPSSLYSHNLGLSESYQPGFLNSTNYLLPWDVMVYSKSKSASNSEQQLDQQKFAGRQKKARSNTNRVPQFTVKVFIGIEYECPRGHRFMLSAPDKVLRAAPSSIVKDTGHKVAESDMPLYFPCPCRMAKPLTAQLMRLHVVTPKAPVLVTLNPKVQPATGAPIFISTTKGPSSLTQSTYWMMRLPFIYATDKENYSENHTGRLLQGVFAVIKITE